MSMNMTRRNLLAATAALSGTPALRAGARAAGRTGLSGRLLGVWRLQDAVAVYANGATGPWYDRQGPYRGVITYCASGVMSVQIASARPPAHSPPDFAALPAAEQLDYLHSYYAYFGRFQLEEADAQVRHFVECSLDPTEVGLTYTQQVVLREDRMTLITQPWLGPKGWQHSRLEWARA